ncbi:MULTISPECIES: hypothetical protein [unclassified Acinetobacter]|uniref:hypothetical protein n=1 Tax=unclassified Acinetobacter TaxID=196816 RepID=UPI00244D2044|nr:MULTISPECIES: hypothetical protein [unclassified Acinetobacter]MDH0032018.1 hypothetical protein [Acinetobacter sp. GD04021]MDH0887674.1 hypothetical protein [Acinetobacter sp. GD03873]MDH1084022.1 hypothetical protein [Acinetobacter sp. GD03983]MDH2191051.1 hypothetical protein [Acinetobacter sp. GD03645]MDH2204534.1 hypothetical protein [Acinetobacter sp. GD03647]
MSILDLPLERQKEIAKQDGFSDVESWRAHVEKLLDASKKHVDSLKQVDYNNLTPEQQASYRRFGNKVASGNPPQ